MGKAFVSRRSGEKMICVTVIPSETSNSITCPEIIGKKNVLVVNANTSIGDSAMWFDKLPGGNAGGLLVYNSQRLSFSYNSTTGYMYSPGTNWVQAGGKYVIRAWNE